MIENPEIKNITVDFNIRYKAFSIINMDNPSSPKWGSLIARHSVNCFSFAAQGEKVILFNLNIIISTNLKYVIFWLINWTIKYTTDRY